MVTGVIEDLNKETPVPSVLVKVEDGVDDKKDQNFLETLLVAHPFLGIGVLIGEVIKVPSS